MIKKCVIKLLVYILKQWDKRDPGCIPMRNQGGCVFTVAILSEFHV